MGLYKVTKRNQEYYKKLRNDQNDVFRKQL